MRSALLLLLASFVLFSQPLLARASVMSGSKDLYIGVGSVFQGVLTTTQSSSGGASLTGQPYLGSLQLDWTWLDSTAFQNSLVGTYTVIPKAGSDGIKKSLLIVGVPFSWKLNPKLALRLGPGVQWYSVEGPGGTTTLLNGTTPTTFYRPDSKSTAMNLLLETGLNWDVDQSLRLKLDVWIPGVLTTRRAINLGLHVAWGIL